MQNRIFSKIYGWQNTRIESYNFNMDSNGSILMQTMIKIKFLFSIFFVSKYLCLEPNNIKNTMTSTVTLRKSLPPTLRAGPVGPRVLILRTCHVIGSRMNTGLIAYSKRSCNIKSNFHHRFPFPVNAVFKISFPVWADTTKMCRIKFQGESLETFFIYEVV